MVVFIGAVNAASSLSRICSILIGLGVGVGVIGAAIAVGVIIGKQPDIFEKKVFKSTMKIILFRSMGKNELDQFYDKYQTLDDLDGSVNEKMSVTFPDSYVKSIIVFLVEKPILISPGKRIRRLDNEESETKRSSIVTLSATTFFKMHINGSQIRRAMENYSEWITLKTVDGNPSQRLATILLNQSIFEDTVLVDMTEVEARKQISFTFDRLSTTDLTTNRTMESATPPTTQANMTTSAPNTSTATTTSTATETSSTTFTLTSTTTTETTSATSTITSTTTTESSSTTSTITSTTTTQSSSTTPTITTTTSTETTSTTTTSTETISTTTTSTETTSTTPTITTTTSTQTTSTTTTITSATLVRNCSTLFESYMAIVFQYTTQTRNTNASFKEINIWSQLNTLIQNRLSTMFSREFIKLEPLGDPNATHFDTIGFSFLNSSSESFLMAYTFIGVGYFNSNLTANSISNSLINTTISLPFLDFNETSLNKAYYSPESSYFTNPVLGPDRARIIYALSSACQLTSPSTTLCLDSGISPCQTDTATNCTSFNRFYHSNRIISISRGGSSVMATSSLNMLPFSNPSWRLVTFPNVTQFTVVSEPLLYHQGIIYDATSGVTIVVWNFIERYYSNIPYLEYISSHMNASTTITNSSMFSNYYYFRSELFLEYSATFDSGDPCRNN